MMKKWSGIFPKKIHYCLHHNITRNIEDNFGITITGKSKTYCLLVKIILKIKPKSSQNEY